MACLYYYKLNSEYPCDVTKSCKLSINEIDSNFYQLKGDDIKSADFIRDTKTLVLTRNNGEKLVVDLSDMTYDLNIDANCGEDGVTLSVYYDGKDGVKQFKVDHLVTLDMLRDKIESIIGTDILTKVITDGTLRGYGTLDSPLGLSGTEKTGMYAPVIARIDLTNGGRLPEVAKLGSRYATIEYTNDYGYLYNGAGLNKIKDAVESEGRGWRVPSKEDWDLMLNLIEPCDYRNHTSAKCHSELGKFAGKYLKSVCGWVGQPACECSPTVPMTSCTSTYGGSDGDGDYIENDGSTGVPSANMEGPGGVDKYGMTIYPAGVVTLDGYGRPQTSGFGETSVMWTTSHVYGDVEQDQYVKVFEWNKGGVVQEAECPAPYYSVRLVKDYNGINYFDTEYIDGVPYKTILFPEIRQIWLASNYAKKEGFVGYTETTEPEVVEVNNGEGVNRRKAVFLNEWNGCYWEKKQLNEGDTVVVESTCFDVNNGEITSEVCWLDGNDVKHCVDVVIPDVAQHNIEYRVFTTGGTGTQDSCDQDLVNTDYLTIERLLRAIIPLIEQERLDRIDGDIELSNRIDDLEGRLEQEIADRQDGDNALRESLNEEIENRIAGDEELARVDTEIQAALNAEIARAVSAETTIELKIEDETRRAISEERRIEEKLDAEVAAREEGDNALGDRIDAEAATREAEDDILDGKIEELRDLITEIAAIEGKIIDSSKNPFTMTAAVEDGYGLTLETKDGIDEHFIRVNFDGNFGEI